jgi:hypothetical protein
MDTGLLETQQVKSLTLCAFKCVAHEKCLSYNYEHESSSELHSCELVDRTKNEVTVTARAGYSHYETVQVCRLSNSHLRKPLNTYIVLITYL